MKTNTSNFLFRHPWDRYAFPGFVAFIWFVILMGFVPDIIHKFRKQGFNYPLAVHIHAAVYVSWLALLTVQTVLIGLLQAGFIRWWGAAMYASFGHGFLGGWMADYLGVTLLVLGIGVYDLVTRRRLHPAYVLGAIWILSWQFIAKWLYVSPWWKVVSLHLLGH
jgi:hypothetical protein